MGGKSCVHLALGATHVRVLFFIVLVLSGTVESAATFESPPELNAADLLPDYLLMGDGYAVDEVVLNDGQRNRYIVRSSLGDVNAEGRDDLVRVIQEIRATNYLREHSIRAGATVGFNQGVKQVAAAPYNKVKQVVFNPLYAIEAVPGEIIDYASKAASVSDLIKYGPRVFVRRSLGIDGARKDLARRLNVSSRTDSEALQEEIRRVGWGVWLGGIAPDVGEGLFDLEFDLSTEVGNLGHGNLGRAVAALRREVLPRSARRILKKMDVPKKVIKTFLAHPHFDGQLREDLATALSALPDTEDRTAFVSWAMGAQDKIEALEIVGLAQVMALHNAEVEPVLWIRSEGEVLLFGTPSVIVVPCVHDYLIYSESVGGQIAKARTMVDKAAPGQSVAFWTLGEYSPRLQEALASEGYMFRMDVDSDYPVFERPHKGMKRLERRFEQKVEEPIEDAMRESFYPDTRPRLFLELPGPEPLEGDTAPVLLSEVTELPPPGRSEQESKDVENE